MSRTGYKAESHYKAGKTLAKGGKESVWTAVSVWGVMMLSNVSWWPEDASLNTGLVVLLTGVLAGGFKVLRNALKHKFGIEIPLITGFLVLLMPVVAGCKTVSLGNEYSATDYYNAEGEITHTTTKQENQSWGGPFTDVENLKQDSLITVGELGEWSMGQGAGVDSVSGAGQVEAFTAGLSAGQQMLGTMMPFLMMQSQPSPTGQPGIMGSVVEQVIQAVLDRLVTDGVLEPVE